MVSCSQFLLKYMMLIYVFCLLCDSFILHTVYVDRVCPLLLSLSVDGSLACPLSPAPPPLNQCSALVDFALCRPSYRGELVSAAFTDAWLSPSSLINLKNQSYQVFLFNQKSYSNQVYLISRSAQCVCPLPFDM